MSSDTLRNTCPYCDYRTDLVTDIAGGTTGPKAGDISLCMRCGSAAVFTRSLALRRPKPRELNEIMRDSDIQQAQRYIRLNPRMD